MEGSVDLPLRQGGVCPAQSSSDSIEGLTRLNGIYTICTRHPRNVWHRNLTNGKNYRKRNGKESEKDGWRVEGRESCRNRPVVYNSVTGFQ